MTMVSLAQGLHPHEKKPGSEIHRKGEDRGRDGVMYPGDLR